MATHVQRHTQTDHRVLGSRIAWRDVVAVLNRTAAWARIIIIIIIIIIITLSLFLNLIARNGRKADVTLKNDKYNTIK